MHADQVVITLDLVRHLVDEQFPRWAGDALVAVTTFGTDHRLFRLGDDLLVRLPVYAASAGQAASDARWLPRLAPHLPVAVPVPVGIGDPTADYPFPWSVVPWIDGAPPTAYLVGDDLDTEVFATELAEVVNALRSVDATDGPRASGSQRGGSLQACDAGVRQAIDRAGDRIDRAAVIEVWEDCLAAPEWQGPGVWIHGDLLPGNLLVRDRHLAAVIDFGTIAVGDPSPDLLPSWTVLPSPAREIFRDAIDDDEATWRRGRGWALAPALTGIDYYAESVPAFAERGVHTVQAVLDDRS